MGREIWIYQLDAKKAKKKLYPNLRANQSDRESFYHFYEKTKNEDAMAFDDLIAKIKTDIQQISPFQLFQIVNWLSESKDANTSTALKEYGIELLYESSTKSIANGWMLQFGAYRDCFDLQTRNEKSYFGVSLTKDYFIGFINYLFCLMAKIIEQRYDLSSKEQIEYDLIKTWYQGNKSFFDLIEQAFKLLEKDWKTEEAQRKKGINTQSTVAANTYYAAESILSDCYRIKKGIGVENSNFIIIDWV